MRETPLKNDRLTVIETPDLLEIIITGKIPAWQFAALSAWLVAWTFAGIFVILQVLSGIPADQKLFMFIWLAFWLYFEYKIGLAWIWRKWGREVLKIRKDKTELRFDVPVRMRASEFQTEEIEGLTNLEAVKGVFVKNYYDSFWVVGGETIGFNYRGKLYSFGRQLPPEIATGLIKLIGTRLKKQGKKR